MEAELSNLKSRNEEISILLQNYRDDNKQLKSKVQRLEEQKNTLTTEACLKIHIITNLFVRLWFTSLTSNLNNTLIQICLTLTVCK